MKTSNHPLAPYMEAISSNLSIAILSRDFKIVWANNKFGELIGFASGELVGHLFEQPHPVPAHGGNPKNIVDTILEGEQWAGEVKSVNKKGDHFWARTSILPVKDPMSHVETFVVFISKITTIKVALDEKHAMLRKLALSEARYRALVENQSDIIYIYRPDGICTFANSRYGTFTNRSPEACIEKNIYREGVPGLPHAYLQRTLAMNVEYPEVTGNFELVDALGTPYWFAFCSKGIFAPCGTLLEIITIGRDVTGLKAAELQKTNYIEALEKIAFITSHNVRSPIASVLGLLELLRMEALDASEWNEVLSSFKKCMDDLDMYTRQLGVFINQRQLHG